jgi:hypothetical protein
MTAADVNALEVLSKHFSWTEDSTFTGATEQYINSTKRFNSLSDS